MFRICIAALAAVTIIGTAQAATLTPTDIVNRHVAAGAKGDVDALMADYADDAIVLQAGQAVQGKVAIRALFERLFPPRTAGAPAGPQINVTKVWEEGSVGFTTWQWGTNNGTDEFIVKDGKIKVQAVFFGAPPAPPAQ